MIVDDATPYAIMLMHHRTGRAVESRATVHTLDERMACCKTDVPYGLLHFVAERIERRAIGRAVLDTIRHLREGRAERPGARVEIGLQMVGH